MNKISRKYKNRFVKFLLTEFILFALFGIFHIHKYDISEHPQLVSSVNIPLTKTDLSQDFLSYCSLHQFNQTIITAKAEPLVSSPLINIGIIQHLININDNSTDNLTKLIPRAPPLS